MNERVETLIVGAGQAGLALSYCLAQVGREHVVLEKDSVPGSVWHRDRWDSFTLVSPNWMIRLPGAEYRWAAPDDFMPRDEVVAYLEQYAAANRMPVRYESYVTGVDVLPDGGGYRVATDEGTIEARNVVLATGLFQHPKVPPYSTALPPEVVRQPSGQYRNPAALPPGAVLVVGSGQSGCQIAEELHRAGRKVYLCTSKAGRAPRRYRGRDIFQWLVAIGFMDRTADKLPTPRARFAPLPHLTGKDGGHSLNLHQFARDGVTLLGHLSGTQDGDIRLAPDLPECLAAADRLEADMTKVIDDAIARQGIEAPEEQLPHLRDGYDAPIIENLNLRSAGITSVIWAMGYSFDFSLVRLPVFDEFGYPVTERGATRFPGLYFLGLPWLVRQGSGLLWGVGEDAMQMAEAIAGRHNS
jgi:putative flavoprotein involved in K+ transport